MDVIDKVIDYKKSELILFTMIFTIIILMILFFSTYTIFDGM